MGGDWGGVYVQNLAPILKAYILWNTIAKYFHIYGKNKIWSFAHTQKYQDEYTTIQGVAAKPKLR